MLLAKGGRFAAINWPQTWRGPWRFGGQALYHPV